jgi:wobble nucleotide-excising tRNase
VRQAAYGGGRSAVIDNMHSLIRDYESEYHFLYSVIHTFAVQEHPTAAPIYLLPNAIRKVLETFLSFKVPGTQNLVSGLSAIKGRVTDKVSLAAIERFAETESHGSVSALLEPSQKAIEEAHLAANALLSMIEELDPDHARAMRRLSTDHPALG